MGEEHTCRAPTVPALPSRLSLPFNPPLHFTPQSPHPHSPTTLLRSIRGRRASANRTATEQERGCRAGRCRCPTPSISSSAKVRRVFRFCSLSSESAKPSPSHPLLLAAVLHWRFWLRADRDNWPPAAGLLVARLLRRHPPPQGYVLPAAYAPSPALRHGSGVLPFALGEVLLSD